MNIKHSITLLVTLLCIPATHAHDEQTAQNPFIRNLLAAQAPKSEFSQEEMDKLVALIRKIAKETGEKLEEDDLILQARLRMFCKQVHAQTGTLLSTTELFNNMNAACEEIGAWKIFCAEHGLEYITPMQLFEQFVATQQQSKNVELNKQFLVGVGLGIGGLGGIAGGIAYADSIINMIKAGGICALAQCAENHTHFTNNLPMNKTQRLGFNIVVDSLVSISTYHMNSKQSANSQIINELQSALSDSATSQDHKAIFRYVTALHDQKKLPTFRQEKKYDITKKDYALLAARSVSHNLIDIIPVPEQDSVYLSLNNGSYRLLSQNMLIRGAKESGKQCVQQGIEAHLSSNQVKAATDPSKQTNLRAQDIARSLAQNSAKEISYALIAQLTHKKIAPETNEKTSALLQICFPEDGIPKTEIHEISRLITISAITLCATTGLNFVTNNVHRLSRWW